MSDETKIESAEGGEEPKAEEKLEAKASAPSAKPTEATQAKAPAVGVGRRAQTPIRAGAVTVVGTGFVLPGQKLVSSAASAVQEPASATPVATIAAARTIHFPPK